MVILKQGNVLAKIEEVPQSITRGSRTDLNVLECWALVPVIWQIFMRSIFLEKIFFGFTFNWLKYFVYKEKSKKQQFFCIELPRNYFFVFSLIWVTKA